MPRKFRCPRPVNPILLMNRAGHRIMQRVGPNTCAVAGSRGDVAGPLVTVVEAFMSNNGGSFQAVKKGGTFTFGRATSASVIDFENVAKTAKPNELRVPFARRVENLSTHSLFNLGLWVVGNGTLTPGITDPHGGTNAFIFTATGNNARVQDDPGRIPSGVEGIFAIWARRRIGTGSIRLQTPDGSTATSIAIDTTWRRFSTAPVTSTASNVGIWIVSSGDEIEIYLGQTEITAGQTNKAPSEDVTVGIESAPFHGVNVDGVKVFLYQNANSVGGGQIVTEAKGSNLTTPWGALYEAFATTNLADTNNDLTGGAETVTLTATGNHTLSVKGTAAVTVAAGTATGTGFGQATDGNPVTFNITSAGTITLTLNSGTLATADLGYVLKQVETGSVASSFVEAPGGSGTRTADDGAPTFDYANWNQNEGIWITDLWWDDINISASVLTLQNSAANNVLNVAGTGDVVSSDGTNTATASGAVVDNGRHRIVVDFATDKNQMFNGAKDVDSVGSWVFSPTVAYDGGFPSSNVFNLAFSAQVPLRFRDLKGAHTSQGKQWIEANL